MSLCSVMERFDAHKDESALGSSVLSRVLLLVCCGGEFCDGFVRYSFKIGKRIFTKFYNRNLP